MTDITDETTGIYDLGSVESIDNSSNILLFFLLLGDTDSTKEERTLMSIPAAQLLLPELAMVRNHMNKNTNI